MKKIYIILTIEQEEKKTNIDMRIFNVTKLERNTLNYTERNFCNHFEIPLTPTNMKELLRE